MIKVIRTKKCVINKVIETTAKQFSYTSLIKKFIERN